MFQGVYTALITPFKNGKVDEAALRALVDQQIQAGITGLVPVGSTGESATLSHDEHNAVIDITISESERFYPAFQYVIGDGKSAEEAVSAAIIDPVGEA